MKANKALSGKAFYGHDQFREPAPVCGSHAGAKRGECIANHPIHGKNVYLRTGATKLALYGLGNIKDERLYRTFQANKVCCSHALVWSLPTSLTLSAAFLSSLLWKRGAEFAR